MALHLEFVVPGPPISNQSKTSTLALWRGRVAGVAAAEWVAPELQGHLKAIIINFYSGGSPSLDVDNMSKPILDTLEGIVYGDDRQIVQAELAHVTIDAPFSIVGVSPLLVTALRAGSQFVYVRIEEPVAPFPLPKVMT